MKRPRNCNPHYRLKVMCGSCSKPQGDRQHSLTWENPHNLGFSPEQESPILRITSLDTVIIRCVILRSRSDQRLTLVRCGRGWGSLEPIALKVSMRCIHVSKELFR